jgi:hypothetical protein
MQLNLFQMSLLRQRVRAAVVRADKDIIYMDIGFVDNILEIKCFNKIGISVNPDFNEIIKNIRLDTLNGIQLKANEKGIEII